MGDGVVQPIFGVIFSKIMDVLLMPISDENRLEIIEDTKLLSLQTLIIGVMAFVSLAISKYCWGVLGENVTYKIRQNLYAAILRKDIGFHDHRENGTSVLTSAMAEDSSIINGVSTESLGPLADGAAALVCGVVIAFFYSWKMALICLAMAPLMVIGAYIGTQAAAGLTEETGALAKEANLLCGDAIVNYKTVQSFGNEELLVEKYRELLLPIHSASLRAHCCAGFGFGVSNFFQFLCFAALFYFGALLIEAEFPDIDSEKVFVALFCIMFGAS